jgi:hypothetical protein
MHKIYLLILLFPLVTFGQRNCATKQLHIKNNGGQDLLPLELNAISENNLRVSTPDAIIKIPVVVHVVYRTATQNISDQQIQTQIDVLNADFRLANTDKTKIPSYFLGVAADANIEFCLASKNPSGNATTGIVRTSTSLTQVGDIVTEKVKQLSTGWDRTKYLNIWVCEIEQGGGILGYAVVAQDGQSSGNKDGVVIDYRYFGTIGTGASDPDFNKGRTATHEIGHYFGLDHIWGDDEGSFNECQGSDFVNDTPNQSDDTGGCPTGVYSDLCAPNANGRMYQNFMDYTEDACMVMFTAGQKTRMLNAIETYRVGLKTSATTKCSTTALVYNNYNPLSYDIYPNVTKDFANISIFSPQSIDVQLSIFDSKGMLVQSKTINFNDFSNSKIDISALPQGIYFIKLQQGDKVGTSKIVKSPF